MTDNMGHSLQALLSADGKHKPRGFDENVSILVQTYEDSARERTFSRLAELGLGIKGNTRPLEVSLLRRVIHRLASTYQKSPSRFLKDPSGNRLSDEAPEHRFMVERLGRARYDQAWKRADRMRTLCRQSAIRFYPSPELQTVTMRVFTPNHVHREPTAAAADTIAADRRFALQLGGDQFEMWTRTSEGEWLCVWLDKDGGMLDQQPWVGGPMMPYEHLPVSLIYDEYPAGDPWLPPRATRIAWTDSLNGIANDLWSLSAHQAHDRFVHKKSDKRGKPAESTGHGQVTVIESDEELTAITTNPKIAENQGVLETFVRLFTLSEDLPSSEFDRSKQVVTGAARLVEEQPLRARQKDIEDLAKLDEAQAWRIFRSVHNFHAEAWGVPEFRADTDMEVGFKALEAPTDEEKTQGSVIRDVAMGAASNIDYIERVYGLNRDEAVNRYHQVRADLEAFPLSTPAVSDDANEIAETERLDSDKDPPVA